MLVVKNAMYFSIFIKPSFKNTLESKLIKYIITYFNIYENGTSSYKKIIKFLNAPQKVLEFF